MEKKYYCHMTVTIHSRLLRNACYDHVLIKQTRGQLQNSETS